MSVESAPSPSRGYLAPADAVPVDAVLYGRERERAELARLVSGAGDGSSAALVLSGTAGAGKSALLDDAIARADGVTVLRAVGVEAEYDLPFAGLHALLWPVIGHLGDVPEPQRGALAAALGLAPPDQRDRFLVSAGVLSLLAAAADAAPVICLVDDAQWLDPPSADALVFVARRLAAEGVVIVFGVRDQDEPRLVGSGLPVLTLGPLDRDAARELLRRSAPDATPAVRDRLLEEAHGNPLALRELPAALSDAQLAGTEPLPEALPLTARLRWAFLQRIERMPQSTRAALLLAAAEHDGELRVIHHAIGAPADEDVFAAAEAAGLIATDTGRFTFRHPLVRSAIYGAATGAQRRAAHRALAGAFDAVERSDLALWHQALSTEGPDDGLAEALERSGHHARERGGCASAIAAYERAAELSDRESLRSRRLAHAARAAWSAGHVERARELIARALPSADPRERAQLFYLSGVIEGRLGWLTRGVAALREAARLTDDAGLRFHILNEAGAMAIHAGDFDEVVAIGVDASTLPRRSDADRYMAAALGAYAADLLGEHDRGTQLAREALRIAEGLDDLMYLISASHTATRHGAAGDGLPYATRAVEIARGRAMVTTLPFALQALARALLGRSQLDVAYSAAEEGHRLALDVQQPWAAGLNLAHLGRIDALRGDEDAVTARVSELGALTSSSGANAHGLTIGHTLGLLDLGFGRPDQALDRLLPVIEAARPEAHQLFTFGVPDAVEAAVRSDRRGAVTPGFARFETWVQASPNPTRLALLARCRALLAESEDAAEHHFAESVNLAAELSPFDRARSELLYGEWLRRHRRRVDARTLLRAANETFERLGTAPWEQRARAELRASGETARRRDPSARDELTPQELQIARLVAGGLSNRVIAAQLFLSPRTIDYHLRKVFAKLEISSRGDLARLDLGEAVPS